MQHSAHGCFRKRVPLHGTRNLWVRAFFCFPVASFTMRIPELSVAFFLDDFIFQAVVSGPALHLVKGFWQNSIQTWIVNAHLKIRHCGRKNMVSWTTAGANAFEICLFARFLQKGLGIRSDFAVPTVCFLYGLLSRKGGGMLVFVSTQWSGGRTMWGCHWFICGDAGYSYCEQKRVSSGGPFIRIHTIRTVSCAVK